MKHIKQNRARQKKFIKMTTEIKKIENIRRKEKRNIRNIRKKKENKYTKTLEKVL